MFAFPVAKYYSLHPISEIGSDIELLSNTVLRTIKVIPTSVSQFVFGAKEEFIVKGVPAIINLCSSPDDVMAVSSIVVIPDPPQKGENVTVRVTGVVQEEIRAGAYMLANMKKGPFKFPQIKFPVCDYLSTGCPVEKGLHELDMIFEIPKMTPGGPYDIKVVLYNTDTEIKRLTIGSHRRIPKSLEFLSESKRSNDGIYITGKRIACAEGSIEL